MMQDRKQTLYATTKKPTTQSRERLNPHTAHPRQNHEQKREKMTTEERYLQKKPVASDGYDEKPKIQQGKEKKQIKSAQNTSIFFKHKELPGYKKINTIPLQQRRLDSLAWLIQGDDTCGAAYFDGSVILLATNNNTCSSIIAKIVNYLISLANISQALSNQLEILSKDRTNNRAKYRQKYVEKCKTEMTNLQNYAKQYIALYDNTIYQKAFERALKKLTYSLSCTYLKPCDKNALDKTFADAIRTAKIKFISANKLTKQPIANVHAEMKIVDYLLGKKMLNNPNGYIGVSKRCCQQCTLAIKAVNHVQKSAIREGDSLIEGDLVTMRDSHRYYFKANCPAFLEQYPLIKTKFLELMKVQTLQEAYNKRDNEVPGAHQIHLNSATDPHSLSDISSDQSPNMRS